MMTQMITNYLAQAIELITREEDGQDLVEYALILVFISIAAIAALMALGPQIAAIYTQISQALTT